MTTETRCPVCDLPTHTGADGNRLEAHCSHCHHTKGLGPMTTTENVQQGHTPTPWSRPSLGDPEDIWATGTNRKPTRVATANGWTRAETMANAAFIVRAVNSHQALLSALEALIDMEWGWHEDEEGRPIPRQPDHSCGYAHAGPSCRTCDQWSEIAYAWAQARGQS